MKLTRDEHRANAEDWIAMSGEPLREGETVDRDELAEQMAYTDADAEDVEEIAELIESLNERSE